MKHILKSTLKHLILIFTLCAFSSYSFGQVTVKFEIDCDSVLSVDGEVHVPLLDNWFMASIDLDFPRNWKNQDTLILTPFSIDNLQHGMTCIEMSPSTDKNKIGWVNFASLNYWEHGEYGVNSDSSYSAEAQLVNGILTLRDKFWYREKGRGKKYKYKVIWTGRNCCSWIRLNPTKKRCYPKQIPKRQAKKIVTVKNY